MAHDLKAHSPSWRAGDGSHGGKSIQPGPVTSHVRARREQTRDGTVKPPRPSSSEAPPPKGFILFQNSVTS